jgi:hypothetical protein
MIGGVVEVGFFVLLLVGIVNLVVGLVNSQMPEQAKRSYSEMFGGIFEPMADFLFRTKLLQAIGWFQIIIAIVFIGVFVYLAVAYWE